MKFSTLLISVAAIAGLASSANANAPAPSSAFRSSSAAQMVFRHILVGDRKLDAGISLPSRVVRSAAADSAASLCFTTSDGEGADNVASYDIKTGAWSADTKRQTLGSHESSGCYKELQG